MARTGIITTTAILAVFVCGCADEPGGTVQFTITGADELAEELQDEVMIDWDGENPWTRELDCQLDSSLSGSWWSLIAVDRSVGNGLVVELMLLDYDGPGTYARDRFQPDSALAVEFEEPVTEIRTVFDVAAGGLCSITVEEGSKSGSFSCSDVPLIVGGLVASEEAGIDGTFACNALGNGSLSDGASRGGRGVRGEER